MLHYLLQLLCKLCEQFSEDALAEHDLVVLQGEDVLTRGRVSRQRCLSLVLMHLKNQISTSCLYLFKYTVLNKCGCDSLSRQLQAPSSLCIRLFPPTTEDIFKITRRKHMLLLVKDVILRFLIYFA